MYSDDKKSGSLNIGSYMAPLHVKQSRTRITEEWTDVTPTMAAAWLEKNTHNRKASEAVVKSYAVDMLARQWLSTGDPIRFSNTSVLIDGQHRLKAIVASGVTLRMLVVRGLPIESQAVIDMGKRRAFSDKLRLDGHSRYIERQAWMRTIREIVTKKATRLSLAEFNEVEQNFGVALDWMERNAPNARGLKRTPLVGALVFAYQAYPEKAGAFIDSVKSGENLTAGDAALTLHRYAVERLTEKTLKQNAREISVKTLRAVQAYVCNEKIRRLEATEESVEFFCKKLGIKRVEE